MPGYMILLYMKVGISIIDFTYYNRFIQAVGSYNSCWRVSGFALWILIFADIKKQVASNKTQPVFILYYY